jgi:hypothetical protein
MAFGRHVLPLAFAVMLALPGGASAQLVTDNPWLERRPLHIAQQGGEIEAPSDTLYAFKTARQKGADMVETDDAQVELFKALAPQVHTKPGTGQVAAFWSSSQGSAPGTPNPQHVALQVPGTFNGLTVVSPDFIEGRARERPRRAPRSSNECSA